MVSPKCGGRGSQNQGDRPALLQPTGGLLLRLLQPFVPGRLRSDSLLTEVSKQKTYFLTNDMVPVS